jgi:methylthioribose-1-phosphate isomerase
VPFLVVAPTTTFDLSCPTGAHIPIENRPAREVTEVGGKALTAAGVEAYNPAFDVTPPTLISAIITERGVIQPVTAQEVKKACG